MTVLVLSDSLSCVCVCVCVCVRVRVHARTCACVCIHSTSQQKVQQHSNKVKFVSWPPSPGVMQVGGVHDSTCQGSNYFLFPILYCKSQVANWPLSRPLAFQTSSPWYHFMILLNTHFLKSETTHQYRLVHAAVIVAHGNTDNVVSCGHLPAK